MSIVYRINDVIDLKINDLIVSISPLNYKVKADMQSYIMAGKPMDAASVALKNAIKKIKGLCLPDGSEYELEFDASGCLSDSCISDLLNIPEATKLNIVAVSLINGIPQGEFIDAETGKPLEGVKFVKTKPNQKLGNE